MYPSIFATSPHSVKIKMLCSGDIIFMRCLLLSAMDQLRFVSVFVDACNVFFEWVCYVFLLNRIKYHHYTMHPFCMHGENYFC